MVLAVVSGVLVPLQLIVVVVLAVADPDGLRIVQGLGWVLFAWWICRGAWLRTAQGRPAPNAPPPWDEPVLTERRAWGYTWLAAACAVACSLAIGWQARHWVG